MVVYLYDLFINIFSNLFLYWWPWIFLSLDTFIIQFFILYLLFLILNSKNIYYVLLYVFILFFIFGIYLALLQLEFFTGFLWVVECTVVFIFLIILFYTNFKGYINDFDSKIFFFNKYIYFIIFFLINLMYFYDFENYIWEEFNVFLFYDDFYESILNTNMNDFSVLLVSYYTVNCLELIITGLILLIGSVVCVNLHKINKNKRVESYNNFFSFFNFFKDSVNFIFTRKQNLHNQNLYTPSNKVFKKKI